MYPLNIPSKLHIITQMEQNPQKIVGIPKPNIIMFPINPDKFPIHAAIASMKNCLFFTSIVVSNILIIITTNNIIIYKYKAI